MTIIGLRNRLNKIIADGYGRKEVCIDKSRCRHPLEEDGVCIFPITKIEISTYEMIDDDGGWKTRADGTTVSRTSLVIVAEC